MQLIRYAGTRACRYLLLRMMKYLIYYPVYTTATALLILILSIGYSFLLITQGKAYFVQHDQDINTVQGMFIQ